MQDGIDNVIFAYVCILITKKMQHLVLNGKHQRQVIELQMYYNYHVKNKSV